MDSAVRESLTIRYQGPNELVLTKTCLYPDSGEMLRMVGKIDQRIKAGKPVIWSSANEKVRGREHREYRFGIVPSLEDMQGLKVMSTHRRTWSSDELATIERI